MTKVELIKNYESEQFVGQDIDDIKVQTANDGSKYITISAVSATIGDWIVKQSICDGLNESIIYSIWSDELYKKYFI